MGRMRAGPLSKWAGVCIYPLIGKEDVYDDIKGQVMEIQRERNVLDTDMVVSCSKEDEAFLDNLEFLHAGCALENGKRVIKPFLFDADGTAAFYLIKNLQQKINAIRFQVTYCIRDGEGDLSPEYGLYLKREPVYAKEAFYPDIDLLAKLEDLQRYIDHLPEKADILERHYENEWEEPEM